MQSLFSQQFSTQRLESIRLLSKLGLTHQRTLDLEGDVVELYFIEREL